MEKRAAGFELNAGFELKEGSGECLWGARVSPVDNRLLD